MSYEITLLPVEKLNVHHPLTADDPIWPETDRRLLELSNSISIQGVLQPVLVDEFFRVGDGRHRLRAAKSAGLKHVPCRVMPESELIMAMLDSEVCRKHRTKTALAYRACIYAGAYEKAGIENRTRHLKEGENSRSHIQCDYGKDTENKGNPKFCTSSEPSESGLKALCLKIGVGYNTLIEVKAVWDYVHTHLDESTTKPKVYGDVSLKQQIEIMVFEEGVGSNAIRDTIRGVEGRRDPDPENATQKRRDEKRDLYVAKAFKALDSHFKHWDKWEAPMRLAAMTEVHDHVKEWPEDIKAQLRSALMEAR